MNSRCRFGHPHRWNMPIYRNGQKVAPNDEWAECGKCGRTEDENGERQQPFPYYETITR